MADQKITVEIDGSHTFELEPTGDGDLGTEATAVFAGPCVVEKREGGSFTVHPVSQVTAVYVGEVPERRVGFPNILSA